MKLSITLFAALDKKSSLLLQKVKDTLVSATKQFVTKPRSAAAIAIDVFCLLIILANGIQSPQRLISPLSSLQPLTQNKGTYEVFGFAPYWTFDKLDNVDYSVLTTMAYFGVPINSNGDLEYNDPGYETFKSAYATKIFKKAHAAGTRVVLTITQMDNGAIEMLMDNDVAQANTISQTVNEVKKRGIDGVNVDFEYMGDPGPAYRAKFTKFIAKFSSEMHNQVPHSKVTVSVYASAVKDPKIYDLTAISKHADGIFMMAYDFAVTNADNAMPTSPLNGHKEGKYWYDIATAVDDFLTVMPADKLILGLPWYGYNYAVDKPEIKAETYPYYSWAGRPHAQTYAIVQNEIQPNQPGVDAYKTGWDEEGKVGFKAYYSNQTGAWRMIFLEDVRSLGIKYDFAKDKKLAGVGMWALGFDEGKTELWKLLASKFGSKLASNYIEK